jgi:hypothetical protein
MQKSEAVPVVEHEITSSSLPIVFQKAGMVETVRRSQYREALVGHVRVRGDFYKLVNNAFFGKSMENVRKRRNVQFVEDEAKLKKLLAQPQLEQFLIVNEDMVVVDRVRSKVKLNKQIYIGFSVLEISKVLIFDFHYNVMMKRYGTNARLLFNDTDSLCYHKFTDDLYRDMREYSDLLDTSGYPCKHPLYSAVNKKVMGKMKDECFSKPPLEFVGLRSKMYSLFLYDPKLVKRTAKGSKKK